MSQMINDQNIYMLNASNKTWINENDIVELPFPDDTQTNAYCSENLTVFNQFPVNAPNVPSVKKAR